MCVVRLRLVYRRMFSRLHALHRTVPEMHRLRVGDAEVVSTFMYDRGFGTGHALDLRAIQVDLDGEIHNVLQRITAAGSLIGATEPAPVTMCGLRLDNVGDPYDGGPTTCGNCGYLAAWKVVAR